MRNTKEIMDLCELHLTDDKRKKRVGIIPLGMYLSKKRIADLIVRGFLFLCAIFATVIVFFIILFLFREAFEFFFEYGVVDFLTPSSISQWDRWNPVSETDPKFNAWPFIVGTVLVTIGAIIVAVPLGLGCAIFIAELAPPKVRMVLKSAVELLAGIPSVIYGFFGLVILSGWLREGFELSSGETWLAASILLGIMALPTIISVSEDAISAVPGEFKEASYGLGGNRWQTISKVVLPSAISGITAAVILGMGRALGETMAVMMVAGSSPGIPAHYTDVFSPVMPITAVIGVEMGEASGQHTSALFALAVILFFMVAGVNSIANGVLGKLNQRFHPKKKKKALFKVPPVVKRIGWKVMILSLILLLLYVLTTWFGLLPGAVITGILTGTCFLTRKAPSKAKQFAAFGLISLSTLAVLAALGIILFYIFSNGIGAINLDFITRPPKNLGREGGIFPAILGTIYLVLGAIIIAVPIGIGAGIYLAEYARAGKVTKVIRMGIDNLNGTPSIVFGLFALSFFVIYMGLGVSLITGQLILGFLILPTVIRTTEEAVKAVPRSFREGSYACGATKWQTIRKVVLPSAMPGIITGTILSIGRAAGETAPIMFTACVFSRRIAIDQPGKFFSLDMFTKPVMALPNHLFILITSVPGEEAEQNAYGTAMVLLILVMAIYLVAIVIRNYFRKKTKW